MKKKPKKIGLLGTFYFIDVIERRLLSPYVPSCNKLILYKLCGGGQELGSIPAQTQLQTALAINMGSEGKQVSQICVFR
jgi:hypothetical protein